MMFEKIKDKLDDIWYGITNPIQNARCEAKWFFQRHFRGYDDLEIWNLDDAFYKWLLIRLKVFAKHTSCYPNRYKSMSSWQKELVNRVAQLELIVNYSWDEFSFDQVDRYLTKKQLDEYRNEKELSETSIKAIAYRKCIENFNKWFSLSINDLWY